MARMKRASMPVSEATVLMEVAMLEVSWGEFAATLNWVQPSLMTSLLMVSLFGIGKLYC